MSQPAEFRGPTETRYASRRQRVWFYLANALVTIAVAGAISLGIAAWNTYQRVNALWAWAPEMEKRVGAVVDGRVQKPPTPAVPVPKKEAPK